MSSIFCSLHEIVSRLNDERAFGEAQIDSLTEVSETDKGPQFMSTVRFFTIRIRDKARGPRELPVLVKVQIGDDHLRASIVNSDGMFANEVSMYQTIIPKLSADLYGGVFPKCYYGLAKGGVNFRNDILVLEDLKGHGFQVPKQEVFLDLPHLTLALRKLGEFHGLSYKFKQNKKTADALKNKLVMTKYSELWLEKVKPILVYSTRKYGRALVEQGYDKALFDRLLDKYDDIGGFFDFFSQPGEPFAVICHGDFNRNNFLFKYEACHPIEIKIFDLQCSFYTDPVLDLSFFLYMNATASLRVDHWDYLLNAYWEGIVASAPHPGFTRSEFFDNFQKKAFSGFVETCFFLPFMLAGNEDNGVGLVEFFTLSVEKQLDFLDSKGGREVYEALRDILKHLVDTEAVQKILEL